MGIDCYEGQYADARLLFCDGQIPNRLNYVCWIEDLMKNDTKKDIYGIDM